MDASKETQQGTRSKRGRKTVKERLDENRAKLKALEAEIADQVATLAAERDKEASKMMTSFGIETVEQLRDKFYFASKFQPVLEGEGIDLDTLYKIIAFAKVQKPDLFKKVEQEQEKGGEPT